MSGSKGAANFCFEAGKLADIERSGLSFLKSGKQSVAEHSYRTAVMGYILSKMTKEEHSLEKLLLLCLFHDIHEARSGDLNYLQQSYVNWNEERLFSDMKKASSFGQEMENLWQEIRQKQSLESVLCADADTLELLCFLKEQQDLGSIRAKEWFDNAIKRLKTQAAKELAQEIATTTSDEWWKLRLK